MEFLKILPPLADFGVIILIGFRTLNTKCFNAGDINWSLAALIFSVIVEVYFLLKIKTTEK